MTIREGTLVTRYSPTFKENKCEEYIDWERHSHAGTDGILDVCIGLVIECIASEAHITVNWLQQCPYHKNLNIPVQESILFVYTYEVGQLR